MPPLLEQLDLLTGLFRPPKHGPIERPEAAMPEAEALAGKLEANAQDFGIAALAAHADAPLRIVGLASMRLGDQRHDVLGLARRVRFEPLTKQLLQFERQPKEDVARAG